MEEQLITINILHFIKQRILLFILWTKLQLPLYLQLVQHLDPVLALHHLDFLQIEI